MSNSIRFDFKYTTVCTCKQPDPFLQFDEVSHKFNIECDACGARGIPKNRPKHAIEYWNNFVDVRKEEKRLGISECSLSALRTIVEIRSYTKYLHCGNPVIREKFKELSLNGIIRSINNVFEGKNA